MYDSRGKYEEEEVAHLPPPMCWGFRVYEDPSSEGDGDEEEER